MQLAEVRRVKLSWIAAIVVGLEWICLRGDDSSGEDCYCGVAFLFCRFVRAKLMERRSDCRRGWVQKVVVRGCDGFEWDDWVRVGSEQEELRITCMWTGHK